MKMLDLSICSKIKEMTQNPWQLASHRALDLPDKFKMEEKDQ